MVISGGQLAMRNRAKNFRGRRMLEALESRRLLAAVACSVVDSSVLTVGLNAITAKASVTSDDGTLATDGTVIFYTARAAYDRQEYTGAIRPCLEQDKAALATVVVVDGQASFDITDLPVGQSWLWADYTSTAGTETLSAPIQITVQAQADLHVEHGITYTVTNPPQIAVTLSDTAGSPLIGSTFAHPASRGEIRQASAQVDFQVPLPPPVPVETTVLGGVEASSSGAIFTSIGYGGSGWGALSGTLTVVNTGSPYLGYLNLGSYNWSHVPYVTPIPTGTVRFSEDSQTLSTTTISGGQAVFSPTTLSVGHHRITVSYDSDAYYVASEPQVIEFDITRTPVTVELSTSQDHVLQGNSFTLTATVKTAQPDTVTPTGAVNIFSDGNLLTTATLGGETTTITSVLPAGAQAITAVYSGDANCLTAESDAITQTIDPNAAPIGRFVITAGKVTGWAVDLDSPSTSLSCDIVIDGRYAKTFKADRFRKDIAGKLQGQGNHGFSVSLPKLSHGRGKHTILVMARDAQTGQSSQTNMVSKTAHLGSSLSSVFSTSTEPPVTPRVMKPIPESNVGALLQ